MFRLRVDAKTREVTLLSAKKRALFTRELLSALAIASLLHLAFLLLFPISRGYLNYPTNILASIAVETSNSPLPKGGSSVAECEGQKSARKQLFHLPETPLTIPPISHREKTSPLPLQPHQEIDPFKELETDFFLAEEIKSSPMIARKTPQIRLSGAIADLDFEGVGGEEIERPISLPFNEIELKKFSYRLLVEGASGKILWFERIGETPHSKEIEKTLLSLLFKKSNRPLLSGKIEVVVTSKRGGRESRPYD